MVSELFDEIIKDMNIDSNDYKKDIDFLKRQEIIISDFLVKFSKIFDSISFVKNIKNNDLTQKLDNNNTFLISQLKQYEKEIEEKINNSNMQQNEKTKQLNRLVRYRELSTIELLIYMQNNVRKLKAQTIKALEQSILNSYDNNITNTNNEKIIIETQQILEKVQTLYYNEVSPWLLPDYAIEYYSIRKKYSEKFKSQEYQLQYEPIKNVCKRFDKHIARLDVLHYNGSKLQTRFNNLHNKVIATLDKMINVIDNNRLDNERIRIEFCVANASQKYSNLVENTDSNKIKTLFNDFNEMYRNDTRLHPKVYLNKLKDKFQTVKKLTDRQIRQQIEDHHTLITWHSWNYKSCNSPINNYMSIICSIMQSLNYNNHIEYKLLVQCNDFLDEFGIYYDCCYLLYLCKWKYILEYNPGQSPQETFKAVLDNNNDSFDLDGNNVNNLEIKKEYH